MKETKEVERFISKLRQAYYKTSDDSSDAEYTDGVLFERMKRLEGTDAGEGAFF